MQLPLGAWVVLVMGVTGSGKTTIGRGLAEATGARFIDADDYHSRENIEKMSRGEALTDADRGPWIEALRAVLQGVLDRGEHAVLACSALKREYRDRIRLDPARMPIVLLTGEPALIATRLRRRQHFAHAALLSSQLGALEAPAHAIVVDVAAPPEAVIRTLLERLGWSPRV
jgi:carbohydrate kinase (thermoresistant glucokinase family)